MNKLKSMISWVISQLVMAGIAHFSYIIFLEKVTNIELTYLNWLGIMLISLCLFPSQIPNFKEKKDDKGPKISRNVSSDGF